MVIHRRLRWRRLLAALLASIAILLLAAAGTQAHPVADRVVPRANAHIPEQFCPTSWNQRASYPIPIIDNAVAVQGNFLYSFGGRSSSYVGLPNAYRYDPVADAWTAIAPLPSPRSAASAVSDGTYIYVI